MKTTKPKSISIILLFIVSTLLIGIFSSCAANDKVEYPLTYEELDAINKAFAGGFANSVEEVGYLDGEKYIYGKYGDAIVFGWSSMVATYYEFAVEDHLFKFPSSQGMQVYHSGEILNVPEAYEKSILTLEQIKELWELHNVHILNNPNYMLTQSELEEINSLWVDGNFASEVSDVEKLSGLGAFVYGRYNGCIVLGKYVLSRVQDDCTVSETEFKLPFSVLLVYKDGELYTLENAYRKKLLHTDDIAEIGENHEKYVNRSDSDLNTKIFQTINSAWGGMLFAAKPADITFRKMSDTFIYGIVDSCIIVGKKTSIDQTEHITVAGCDFNLPSMSIKIIYEGTVCSLTEAFAIGILTQNQISALCELHKPLIS